MIGRSLASAVNAQPPMGKNGAPPKEPGKFPKSTTTLRAEVLATMLAGDDVTGLDSVFAGGSTKLATVMRALTRRYRWPIECQEFATNTTDGQVAWVSMYTLPADAVARAFELGAAVWIDEVRGARLNRLRAQQWTESSALSLRPIFRDAAATPESEAK